MTREEARLNLVALGIEEPTDAQVTNYLNQFHSNRNPNPTPTPAPQPTPSPNPTPNPEPTPANDEELANMRRQIEDLQRENARKDILAYAVSKGLTGEQVQKVLNAFTDNVDAAKSAIDSIGQIISENRESAARAKEQEIAGNAGNPGGGNGGGNPQDEKPDDVKNAESIAFGGLPKNAQSARDFYK